MDAKALTEERGAVYGHPLDDFSRAAALKNALFEMPDPILRHTAEMIAVKLARLINSPAHLDSWDDIAGYALCARKIIEERKRRAPPQVGGIGMLTPTARKPALKASELGDLGWTTFEEAKEILERTSRGDAQ
jgi:hypothetical protein